MKTTLTSLSASKKEALNVLLSKHEKLIASTVRNNAGKWKLNGKEVTVSQYQKQVADARDALIAKIEKLMSSE